MTTSFPINLYDAQAEGYTILMKIKYIFNLLLPFQMKRKKAEGITLTIFPFLLFTILFNTYFSVFVQPVGNIDQELLLFVILFVIMSPAFLR